MASADLAIFVVRPSVAEEAAVCPSASSSRSELHAYCEFSRAPIELERTHKTSLAKAGATSKLPVVDCNAFQLLRKNTAPHAFVCRHHQLT
jgi:hypothetical protein